MKELPLIVASEITIQPAGKDSVKATCKVIGARHRHFIIVEKPVLSVNERLSLPLEGDLNCCYLYQGVLYRFQTKVRRDLPEDLTMIEYPLTYETRRVRKDHRIRLNIDASLYLENTKDTLQGVIRDISKGGCSVSIPSLVAIAEKTQCQIVFALPNTQPLKPIEALVRSVHYSNLKKTTQLGLQFLGPPEPLAKISSFCTFCMLFKV